MAQHVTNEYNQPLHNLLEWWKNNRKPIRLRSIHMLQLLISFPSPGRSVKKKRIDRRVIDGGRNRMATCWHDFIAERKKVEEGETDGGGSVSRHRERETATEVREKMKSGSTA
ncbi:unnamed protein product [Dovyalis caffra]|uniref:Uncharacterized protein n=1 Tax=Dovyalis caffra TaxID=77055 RepID=A0AAV1R5I5_9ROSI|nr:unnamed protein product [Dovyalis caffra]